MDNRILVGLLFTVLAGCGCGNSGGPSGNTLSVTYRDMNGIEIPLSQAAARRFLEILSREPEYFLRDPGDPNPRPMGTFVLGRDEYSLHPGSVEGSEGERIAYWKDPVFREMVGVYQDHGFGEVSEAIVREVVGKLEVD